MLIIVGAGASGLCSAITSARKGVDVTILDQNSRIGRKILVSGNGRCNIANRHLELLRFHTTAPKRVQQILQDYSLQNILEFLNLIGIEIEEELEGKLFPMNRQASSVVSLLVRECQRLGVKIISECKVTHIQKEKNSFILQTSKGVFKSKQLLLTTGSPASPQLGGSDLGIEFARTLGHNIIPSYPALVPLESEATWTKIASGVKIYSHIKLIASGVEVCQKRGDILFTDYGVSGLAVLDISREVSIKLSEWEPCDLSIDLMPKYSKSQLNNILNRRIDTNRNLPIDLWLEGIIHKKLVPIILKYSKLQIKTESQLNKKLINSLIFTIKNLTLPINNTRGFRYAEVATGGVDLREIDPKTLQSLIVKGLYFAGEILDVDGDRGGFNFSWAWITGIKVGNNLKRV